MDINLFAVGIGNSRLSLGAFVNGELARESVVRVPIEDRSTWNDAIRTVWESVKDTDSPVIVGASVNPTQLEAVEHAIEQLTGQSVRWIGDDLAVPLKLKPDQSKQTGVDRLLVAAAAFEQMGKACVVVDAGTAITVDCINDAGEFLGGAIAPGIRLQLEALHAQTAKLPAVTFERPAGTFAHDTEQAIRQGVYHGLRGLVKELTESYATELGYWPDVIATGGDASALFEGWELIHAVAPELLFYGVALAAVEDQLKQDD